MLKNILWIYEKLICNQLYDYFDGISFPGQCSFRKRDSSQHCLLVIWEKFRKSVDKANKFGTLFTDLSKAFDSIDHKLLTDKSNTEYEVRHLMTPHDT